MSNDEVPVIGQPGEFLSSVQVGLTRAEGRVECLRIAATLCDKPEEALEAAHIFWKFVSGGFADDERAARGSQGGT